ncbi:hypothetical protein [Pseudonocardia alni]|uniref:hypothetical protein n=1 Tax=Pseudonocardia alni TaxID=33907 RepID=UPI0027A977CE|nr:hypothetical protein PaSha_14180 [Pseudonocardia alni]
MTTLRLPDPADLGLTDLNTEYWWTDRDGQLTFMAVDVMTVEHRQNLLRWIRAHAHVLARIQRRTWAHYEHAGTLPRSVYLERIEHLERTEPPVWIEDTTLVRRLVALTPSDPHPPRRGRLLPARLNTGARR